MQCVISCLTDLARIDRGVLDRLFANALMKIQADLVDRASVKGAREIHVILRAEPVVGSAGNLAGVDVEFEIKTKAPPLRTIPYSMGCQEEVGLLYNDLAPENFNQRTLDQEANAEPETNDND